jgi:protein-L-isoaspartate(D-aspartate) O-methyltransferase
VLEVGTGSGYNAALLASLVGDASLVTTIDIDEQLVASARSRLAALGWGDVNVVAGDGWAGVVDGAPYDRIVATVGVSDVAPAWIAQLAAPPDAFMLLPLHHGGVHPIVRVTVDAPSGSVGGRTVARSGFVAIRGHQASRAPWRHAGSARANEPVGGGQAERLPPALATHGARSRTTPWDFSYWLAMADDRTANLCTLVDDDGSVAVIDVRAGLVSWSGASGDALRDTLVARAEEWLAMGAPRAEAWHSTFVPVAAADSLPPEEPGRRYVIRRVDHVQVVTLPT